MLIHKLRLQKGWSQQQLADLSGLSVRTIQRMEQGQPASTESLKSLAAVFEIDFHQLQGADMTAEMNQNAVAGRMAGVSIEEEMALGQVRKLRRFYRHLIQYVLVVSILAVINLWHRPAYLWVGWVALGWGVGVLSHALQVWDLGPFGPRWEKVQVEKRLGRKL